MKKRSLIIGFLALAVAGFTLVGSSWAGWQRDAVCGGGCGGGCGPCPGGGGGRGDRPDPEDVGAKLREQRYNEIYEAEKAARARKDYQEALRLALQRQELLDGPKVRAVIALFRGLIADQAGDFRTAIRYFDKTVEENPEYGSFVEGYKKWVGERLEAERQAAEREAARREAERREAERRAAEREAERRKAERREAEQWGVVEQKIRGVAEAVSDTGPVAASPMEMIGEGSVVAATAGSNAETMGANGRAAGGGDGKPAPVPVKPPVVGAGDVPSGLPRDVEDAISRAYSHAPEGVGGRVRKGFQAVMAHDWKVARAWFLDALRFDPENVGLKRLAELCNYPLPKNEKSIPSDAKLPQDSDIKYLFPDDDTQPEARPASPQGKPVMGGVPEQEARELEDHILDLLQKQIDSDPALNPPAREKKR